MGFVSRRDFSRGWTPNADDVNGPVDALLRADNLILDELGVVSLRQGLTTQSSSYAGGDVHSLFTTYINAVRYRMAGVSNSVYANGAAIATALAGANDVYFGFQLGQILFARSTSKKKYDGTTVRNWGISMTGPKPTAVAASPDGKVLATGAEKGPVPGLPTWFAIEKAFPNGVVTWGPNHYQPSDPLYNATGAIILNPAPTKRAVYEFDIAPTGRDYTTYDGGTIADDDDYMSLHLWLSDPRQVQSFHVQIGVFDLWWDKDYYNSPEWTPVSLKDSDPHRILPVPGETLPALPEGTVTATNVGTAVQRPAGSTPSVPSKSHIGLRRSPPLGGQGSGGDAYPNAGWTEIRWRRGDFTRMGNSAGKGWNTVTSVRLVLNATVQDLVARVDSIKLAGGAIIGPARWRYVYVRNDGKYNAKSAMSAASDEVTLDHQGGQITVPFDGSRDSQVNEIWLYRFDQGLDTYYRTVVKTGIAGTSPVFINDSVKSKDALEINIPIELDNVVPPDNIIGIVGPHFDRTLVLTSDGVVWPSRKLDPDAFCTGQALVVCGPDETPLWIYKAVTEVFIGTTKDIYRLEGTGNENPDGSIDYLMRNLNMDHKPLNEAVAHEGNQIVFFSDDGWRAFAGESGSSSLTGETSLLYRGYTRYGVSSVNIAAGRFRASLNKGKFVAITPEGASTTSSSVLYRYWFSGQRWYRHPFTPSFRSIFQEKDGTVLIGSSAGVIYTLDSGTTDDGSSIPVVLWTKVDDLGMPYQRKKGGDLMWRSDTGGATASIAVHLDGSAVAAVTRTVAQPSMGRDGLYLADQPIFRHIQFRVTGSFSAFRLFDYGVQFRERPVPMLGQVVEALGGSPGVKVISGFVLKCCTLGQTLTVTPILDGVADPQTFDILTSVEEPETLTLQFEPTALAGNILKARRATQIALDINDEIEIDSWSPIVSQRQPIGVKVWDSGPIFDGSRERVWLRELLFKVRAKADLVCTPFFDGVAFPSVTIEVSGTDVDSDCVFHVPVGRGYVGRQPRLVVQSCEEFFPYWVQEVRRESGAPSQKQRPRAPMTLETPGGGSQ